MHIIITDLKSNDIMTNMVGSGLIVRSKGDLQLIPRGAQAGHQLLEDELDDDESWCLKAYFLAIDRAMGSNSYTVQKMHHPIWFV